MTQDPDNRYIETIVSRCDLAGRDVLEIGCGKGRLTADLARYARRVVATDPDLSALEVARAAVGSGNVAFIPAVSGVPNLSGEKFDLVIYTLSLHHVPIDRMHDSLSRAAKLVRDWGAIAILEPGNGGSFTEAKERFGAGSGDERPAREAAILAMRRLEGWSAEETVCFRVRFLFRDEKDFLASMLPGFRNQPESFIRQVREFLGSYRTPEGIILDAGRRLDLLRRG